MVDTRVLTKAQFLELERSFWEDIGKSFTFLTELDNLAVIIGYAVMMTIYPAIL